MASKHGYEECSVCGKMYTAGSLEKHFEGFGKVTVVPQRRWFSESEIKRVRIPIVKPVCPDCGGGKVPVVYQEPLWKAAAKAWCDVPADSPLARFAPKRR